MNGGMVGGFEVVVTFWMIGAVGGVGVVEVVFN